MSLIERIILSGISSEISRHIIHYLADILGIPIHEVNDPSIKCRAVLERGLTPDVCMNFREIRRWVLCRTWDLLDKREYTRFRDAIRRAWEEARIGCGGAL